MPDAQHEGAGRAGGRARAAVLVSGSGRTLEGLLEHAAAGTLPLEVALVVASRPDAFGLERARRRGVPARVVARRGAASTAAFTAEVFDACREAGAELVLLAGWLALLRPIPADFRGRVLNIHPALLPAFGGKGFYGDRVHAAVLAAGARETGCTVHLVDDEYDHGPVLLQRTVPVLEGDDVPTLAARVFEAEREAYPAAIRAWCAGRAAPG